MKILCFTQTDNIKEIILVKTKNILESLSEIDGRNVKLITQWRHDNATLECYGCDTNIHNEKINTHNSKLILLPFEKFVINPDNWINEILNFLEQKYSKNLKQELKNQNVPRKILNQGFKRKVYERYGNKIIKDNKAENMSYEEADLNYREYINEQEITQ